MRKHRRLALLALTVLTAAAMTGVAYGSASGHGKEARDPDRKGGRAEDEPLIHPEKLEAAKEADQLIVVVGSGRFHADTYYYTKDQDTWKLEWKEASIVGREGITVQKAEGDGKTPAGTYGFNMAFGVKADPGSRLPYHRLVKGDYWVDDGASPYYNRLVNTTATPKSWNSAEHLEGASPYYDYALALDYNQECVPGKGSAIFLHCFTASPGKGSGGCICLPDARVRALVRAVTEKTRIVIARDADHLK